MGEKNGRVKNTVFGREAIAVTTTVLRFVSTSSDSMCGASKQKAWHLVFHSGCTVLYNFTHSDN